MPLSGKFKMLFWGNFIGILNESKQLFLSLILELRLQFLLVLTSISFPPPLCCACVCVLVSMPEHLQHAPHSSSLLAKHVRNNFALHFAICNRSECKWSQNPSKENCLHRNIFSPHWIKFADRHRNIHMPFVL